MSTSGPHHVWWRATDPDSRRLSSYRLTSYAKSRYSRWRVDVAGPPFRRTISIQVPNPAHHARYQRQPGQDHKARLKCQIKGRIAPPDSNRAMRERAD